MSFIVFIQRRAGIKLRLNYRGKPVWVQLILFFFFLMEWTELAKQYYNCVLYVRLHYLSGNFKTRIGAVSFRVRNSYLIHDGVFFHLAELSNFEISFQELRL